MDFYPLCTNRKPWFWFVCQLRLGFINVRLFLWHIAWLVSGYETAWCWHFNVSTGRREREMKEDELKLWGSSVNKLRSADILIYKDTITFKRVL